MRIITGRYKGRHFDIPKTFKARPTTDFAKENIFNVLMQYIDFEGATALDLFSGTGSITLELLSRGCSHVISVELDRDHHRFIQQCLQKLTTSPTPSCRMGEVPPLQGRSGGVIPLRADVFRYVKSCKQQFDFIFADPPYALKELPEIPDMVIGKGLLKEGGIFVFEHGKDHDFSHHPHFIEHRSYGSVNFSLFGSEPSHQG